MSQSITRLIGATVAIGLIAVAFFLGRWSKDEDRAADCTLAALLVKKQYLERMVREDEERIRMALAEATRHRQAESAHKSQELKKTGLTDDEIEKLEELRQRVEGDAALKAKPPETRSPHGTKAFSELIQINDMISALTSH